MTDININLGVISKDAVKNIQKFAKDAKNAFDRVDKNFQKLGAGLKKAGRNIGDAFKGVGKAIFSIQGAIAGVAAFLAGRAILGGIEAITDAAAVQEDAINQLNTALRLSGDFSEEASQSFQQFATQLQANSKIGDEVALSQLALAKSFGASNEQAKDLVQAAADLSAATGISLDSAVRNLGKTFSGLTGELGEVVPELKTLGAESLKAGGGIDFILQRFGGAALSEINTFSGATAQLSNTFGDLQEELGFVITQNPAVIAAIKTLTGFFQELGVLFQENKEGASGFIETAITGIVKAIPNAIRGIANFVKALETPVTVAFAIGDAFAVVFEKISIAGVLVANNLVTGFKVIETQIRAIVAAGAGALNLIGVVSDETFAKLKQNAFDSGAEVVEGLRVSGEAVKDLFSAPDVDNSDAFQSTLSGLDAIADAAEKTAQAADIAVGKFDDAKAAAGKGVEINIKGGKPLGDAINKDLAKLQLDAAAFAKEVGKAGLNATEAAKFDIGETLGAQLKKIQSFQDKNALSATEAENLRVLAIENANEKILNIEIDANAKGEAERKKALEQANADRLQLLSTIGLAVSEISQAFFGLGSGILDGIKGITDDAQQNIETVGNTLSGAIAPLLDKVVPGLGGIAGSLLSVLSAPPDALAKQIEGFVDAIPQLINRIAENIPTLLTALVEGFIDKVLLAIPEIIDQLAEVVPGLLVALVDAITSPKFINAFIKSAAGFAKALLRVVPQIATSLAEALPVVIQALAAELPSLLIEFANAAGGIILALVEAAPQIIIGLVEALPIFIDALIEALPSISVAFISALVLAAPLLIRALVLAAPQIAFAIVDAIKQSALSIRTAFLDAAREFGPTIAATILDGLRDGVKGIFEGISPGGALSGGGGGGAIGKAVSAVGSATGLFQDGGLVPQGFPNDTFPASLSSGEIVIPRGDTERLSDFLDTQDNNRQTALLGQIASMLGRPQQVATSINVDGTSLADVILELNRSNARLA